MPKPATGEMIELHFGDEFRLNRLPLHARRRRGLRSFGQKIFCRLVSFTVPPSTVISASVTFSGI